EFTVVFDDLPAAASSEDLAKLSKPADFYDAFTRYYAPILADNLLATLDQKPLAFRCRERHQSVRDEKNEPLGHLRCDLLFEAPWQLEPGKKYLLAFREGNYELESGLIRLSVSFDEAIQRSAQSVPDKKLQDSAPIDWKPGDDAKLRTAAAVVELRQST